jgi:hypothetical protein
MLSFTGHRPAGWLAGTRAGREPLRIRKALNGSAGCPARQAMWSDSGRPVLYGTGHAGAPEVNRAEDPPLRRLGHLDR